MQLIVFTDLDGTLLDSRYTFGPATEAIRHLEGKGIPLVIVSTKTAAEIRETRKVLGNTHPFVAENGGSVHIPSGYFGKIPHFSAVPAGDESVISLGRPYEDLREGVRRLQEAGLPVRGFGDMSVEEVAALTGLRPDEAARAKDRHHDEPVVGDGADMEAVRRILAQLGLRAIGGRFFHVTGGNDKGSGVEILIDLYRRRFGRIVTAAFGDAANDLPMLQKVDFPFLVRKRDGRHEPTDQENVAWLAGVGPEGWIEGVRRLLEMMELVRRTTGEGC